MDTLEVEKKYHYAALVALEGIQKIIEQEQRIAGKGPQCILEMVRYVRSLDASSNTSNKINSSLPSLSLSDFEEL